MDSDIALIAFSSRETGNPDAIIVTNINKKDQKIAVTVLGTKATEFEAFRTTKSPDAKDVDHIDEKYKPLGEFPVENGKIVFISPAGSVTTFFAKYNRASQN